MPFLPHCVWVPKRYRFDLSDKLTLFPCRLRGRLLPICMPVSAPKLLSAAGEARGRVQQPRRPPGRGKNDTIGHAHRRLLWSHRNRSVLAVGQRKELPAPLHSLKRVGATGVELKTGADDEIFDRPRDKHLAGASESAHARPDVDCEPRNIVVDDLALAGMQPCSHVEVQCPRCLDEGVCAADRAGGTIKDAE